MSAVRFEQGQPVRRDQPVILVAVRYEPADSVAAVRRDVRWLAEAGWRGIWLSEAAGSLAEAASETARRAGLAVVLEPGVGEPASHQLAATAGDVAVADPLAAFERCFAGQRVIVGEALAVYGLHRYLALADEPGRWSPQPAPAGWVGRGHGAESGWFSAAGDGLELVLPAGFHGAVHLVDPIFGDILGLLTPPPGDSLELRVLGEPLAIYCGPNRYVFNDYRTRPE